MSRSRKLVLVMFVCSFVMLGVYYTPVIRWNSAVYKLWGPLQKQETVADGSAESNELDEDYGDILRSFLFPRKKCPTGRFLSVIPGGNLGNMIWEYMSLYVIARLFGDKYNLVPYVNSDLKKAVETAFERLSIPSTNEVSPECLNLNRAQIVHLNETFTFNLKDDTPIILGRYSARYEEVLRYGIENVKKEMRFKREYVEIAEAKLKVIKDYFEADDNAVYVGIHYRGTDYVRHLQKYYSKDIDPHALYKYYVKAMTYFKMKYSTVIFLFFSIDYGWTATFTPRLQKQFNVTVNPNKDDRVSDLALMAHCNHTIINYGTFGATAAYFAQGTTFVYDLNLPLDYRGATVAMGMAEILPNWFLLS